MPVKKRCHLLNPWIKGLLWKTLWKIAPKFHRNYIQGYFDGDGHIRLPLREVRITGTKAELQAIQRILLKKIKIKFQPIEQSNLKYKKWHRSKGHIFSLKYSEIKKLRELFNFIYKNSPFKLERKYHAFKTLLISYVADKA